MQNHISLLEKTDNVINRSFSHDFHDLVAFYMVNFNSQNFQSLINCEFENEEYYAPFSKSVMSFLPARVLLQQSHENFQPLFDNQHIEMRENKGTNEGMNLCHAYHLKNNYNSLGRYILVIL